MVSLRVVATLVMFVLLVASRGAEPAAARPPPFRPGERLTYSLSWGVFNVGGVSFEVKENDQVNGQDAFHFVMEAQTDTFADAIYKVRDRIESWAATDMSRSLHYIQKQNEGSTHKDLVVTFDWDKKQAQESNFGRARDPIAVAPTAFDPLAVFYLFRTLDLTGKTEVKAYVSDGKKHEEGVVRIVKREEIELNDKKYQAILVEPDMQKVGGVFKKNKDAKLQLWFSDDARRIPLRITSKVAVGSFTAELVSDIPGGEPAAAAAP